MLKVFQSAECVEEQKLSRSKVCRGVKCVEKQSELGREQTELRGKVFERAKCVDE